MLSSDELAEMDADEIEQELKRAYLDGFMKCHEGYARGGHYKAYHRAVNSWENGRERLASHFADKEYLD